MAGEYLDIACTLAQTWDEFTVHVGEISTSSEAGLWQPVTDERILAVMPKAGDGTWLIGERGLAVADCPISLIQATEDSPYQPIEAEFIFRHYGSPEKSMISFVGFTHSMVYSPDPAWRMKHFAVAFFGYHLQGREDHTYYFFKEFVKQFDDLT